MLLFVSRRLVDTRLQPFLASIAGVGARAACVGVSTLGRLKTALCFECVLRNQHSVRSMRFDVSFLEVKCVADDFASWQTRSNVA